MFSNTQSYLGIDIGHTSIKVVELRRIKGKPTLENYSYSEDHQDFTSKDLQLDIGAAAKTIKKICADAGIKSSSVVAAMPSFSVFSSVVSLEIQNKKELEQAVMLEAKKVIPIDLQELILDWKIIEDLEPEEKYGKEEREKEESRVKERNSEIKILLTGAPKSLVKKYIAVFQEAKMNLLSLETEIFSLVRSLIGADNSIIALVDLGAVNTDIAIIEGGLPMFSRSLDAGGIMATKAVADSLKVDFKRSEQFKRDLSGSMNESRRELPKIIQQTISPIISEIKYSLNLFQQENNKKIEKIVLSGGGANLSNISKYISEELEIKAIVGDPWARVVYPLDLKPILDEIGPKMSIAVGLALRETI